MVQNVLLALSSANAALTKSQLSLATGKRVNSALDAPGNWNVARRAETSIRSNTAGNSNSQHSMDVIDTAVNLYQDLEKDLQRLQEITFAYNDASLSNDEKVAYETEASQLADKWDGDASIANFTYNGYAFWDAGSLDLATTAMGEGTNSNQSGGGATFVFPVTTVTTQSPGTIWAITGIATGSIDNSGTAAAGTIDLSLATLGNTNENALESARWELSNLAAMRSTFQAHIDMNNSSIAASEGVRSRAEDVDTAAQSVAQMKLTILQQLANVQTAAGNTQSQQVLRLFA